MHFIDKSFIRAPKKYIIQSLVAVLIVGLILFFWGSLTHAVIVAGLGASSFIVFAMPHSIASQPRRLIGGHIIGMACGTVAHFGLLAGPLGALTGSWEHMPWIAAAVAVGLSIFLMPITDTEHPPAASSALGIAIDPWSYLIIIFILLFSIGLAIAKRVLRNYLIDLC
jgi:CBS-domain-containing membrane protein